MKYKFEVKFYENPVDNKVRFTGILEVDASDTFTINEAARQLAEETHTYYGNVKFLEAVKA